MQNILNEINNFWSSNIGHLNENQRNKVIELLLDLNPNYILEIGFAGGRHTSTALAACVNLKKMYSIDIDFDYMNGRHKIDLIKNKFGDKIDFIEGDSNKLLNDDFFNEYFPYGIDYVFVDGCHTYNGAIQDMRLCYPRLNDGGLMIVDDYMSGLPDGCNIPAVTNAVDDFSKENSININRWNLNGKSFAIFTKEKR